MDALEKRMDALEKRMDALEKRMDALEKRMDALENRMDLIEHRVGTLESGASAYELRFEAIETELRRLRALFEENERTLAIILEVLSNYVKKSEKVDRHDGILIGQRHDLDITQSVLKLHIQDKKVHVSPKPGRPKKAHQESEV
jgi:chromosome segregation ATPase